MDVRIEKFSGHKGIYEGYTTDDEGERPDEWVYFDRTVTPIETFCYDSERRPIDACEQLTNYVVLECGTDGSVTPRNALVEATDFLIQSFMNLGWAIYRNCKITPPKPPKFRLPGEESKEWKKFVDLKEARWEDQILWAHVPHHQEKSVTDLSIDPRVEAIKSRPPQPPPPERIEEFKTSLTPNELKEYEDRFRPDL
eukprot:GHVN01079118.1.p1 GENE.GHVN01079118.1~~GHVN01079118.1.p1  ORF type:complete len:223 (-),score=29.74 GHVN01079118.1:746-1336(-)